MKAQKTLLRLFFACIVITFVSIFLPWTWGISVVHSSDADTYFKVAAFIFTLLYIGCISPKSFGYGIVGIVLNLIIFGIGIHDSIADIRTYGSTVFGDTIGVYIGILSTLGALIIAILAIKSSAEAAKALERGEYNSLLLSSEEALEELKKCKEKFDLELLTEEEYTTRKEELAKFIN